MMRKPWKTYDSLILIGLDPKAEDVLQRFIEKKQLSPLVFRSEEAFLWDPYGSLTRSVMSALQRYPSIRTVWIIGLHEVDPCTPMEEAKPASDPARTLAYIIRHLTGLDAERWLRPTANERATVMKTARLLQDHPLMPKSVAIRPLVLDANANAVVVGPSGPPERITTGEPHLID